MPIVLIRKGYQGNIMIDHYNNLNHQNPLIFATFKVPVNRDLKHYNPCIFVLTLVHCRRRWPDVKLTYQDNYSPVS